MQYKQDEIGKKVLFITTRLIYPTNSGRKVVLYNYCKGLHELHNCEVYLFSFLENGDDKTKETPKFIKAVFYGERPSYFEMIYNIIINSLIRRKWPLQVSAYYSKKTQKRLDKIVRDINPDIIICDMVRTAEYVKNYKCRKILDMDDLLSKRYYRQIRLNMVSKLSYGNFVETMGGIITKIVSISNVLNKLIFRLEYNLLKKYEISVVDNFNFIIFVSPIEAEEYNRLVGRNKAIDITIGVDYDYFSSIYKKSSSKNIIIGFLGNMSVAHNRDAVDYFISKVLPRIKEKYENITFRIIGKCPHTIKDLYSSISGYNIEVTGEVEDIREYVQDCTIMVAPLLYGTGIKTKILEAMAMGRVTVSNEIGYEGIKINDSLRELICYNTDDYVNKIVRLINDDEYRQNLERECMEFIKQNYQWNSILQKFAYLINFH